MNYNDLNCKFSNVGVFVLYTNRCCNKFPNIIPKGIFDATYRNLREKEIKWNFLKQPLCNIANRTEVLKIIYFQKDTQSPLIFFLTYTIKYGIIIFVQSQRTVFSKGYKLEKYNWCETITIWTQLLQVVPL